jgi:tetrahydromethanopterin S-methyltransferase subunit G
MEASERIFELEKKVEILESGLKQFRIDIRTDLEEIRAIAGRINDLEIDLKTVTAKKKERRG